MIWLKENAYKIGDNIFINDLTYKEIYKRVLQKVKKINKFVNKSKRIAIYSPNSIEALIILFSLLILKKEVLMLNFHLTEKEVQYQSQKLGIDTIVSINNQYLSFDEINNSSEDDIEVSFDIFEEDVAIIMNTSATIGEFKSVPIKWKQITAHVESSAKTLGVDLNDNWLGVLPIFHVGGLMIVFRTMYNGTTMTLLEKFEEERVISLINNKEVNIISLVPTMLKRIISRIGRNHGLRILLLGGEFIFQKLVDDCLEKNIPIYKTYGMTETTSQQTTFSVLDNLSKKDSVGLPLAGVSIILKNKDFEGIGEIWLNSPMLMDGYINKEKLNGDFFTGDIGYIDNDGYLYVLNRRTDIIISGGENIYPKEIEDLLYKLPNVVECAVVAKDDENYGQIPILFIVANLEKKEIEKYLLKNLAKYKVPKEIYYKKELPKNATGKISRKELRV